MGSIAHSCSSFWGYNNLQNCTRNSTNIYNTKSRKLHFSFIAPQTKIRNEQSTRDTQYILETISNRSKLILLFTWATVTANKKTLDSRQNSLHLLTSTLNEALTSAKCDRKIFFTLLVPVVTNENEIDPFGFKIDFLISLRVRKRLLSGRYGT